jgi:hypothetical protein
MGGNKKEEPRVGTPLAVYQHGFAGLDRLILQLAEADRELEKAVPARHLIARLSIREQLKPT